MNGILFLYMVVSPHAAVRRTCNTQRNSHAAVRGTCNTQRNSLAAMRGTCNTNANIKSMNFINIINTINYETDQSFSA